MKNVIPLERIKEKILMIRGHKVMIDRDLAELYEVKTKVLNQAVKRSKERFPRDFMFQLSKKELQEVVTVCDHLADLKYSYRLPYVFTEQGIAMLSSILKSKIAIKVNILIMRAFVKLRTILITNEEIKKKIEIMERKYDKQFAVVFEAIKTLIYPPEKPRKIGFLREND